MTGEPRSSLIERGRAHYASRAWADAYDALTSASRAEPLDVADVERLAFCAAMLSRDQEMLEGLERAHDLYLAAGNAEAAARTAFWQGFRLAGMGEIGRSSAWFGRAQQLVERLGEPSVLDGFLLLPACARHLASGEPEKAAETAARAGEIARRYADPDLEALSQSWHGRALLRLGELERGLTLLDLSMLTASGSTVTPAVVGVVYCSAISNCTRVFALDRAREWTRELTRFCDAHPQMITFSSTCHVHCSEVYQATGKWSEAEREAERAIDRIPDGATIDPGPLALALYQRAELKRLLGEFDEAERLYRQASENGREPQPGLALLRLAQGKHDQATVAIRRVLAGTTSTYDRMCLLPAAVEVLLAAGALDEARVLVEELEAALPRYPNEVLRATAAHARGSLCLAEGDPRAALTPLGAAFEAWQRIGAPYLAARVRVELGRACEKLGDRDGAELAFAASRAIFESLGARHDLERIGAPTAAPAAAGGLTPRELEVLRLVAAGLTNKVIAARLSLSEKTVDRHLSNIFVKLNVSSRSAATAYAFQHGLAE